MKRRFDRGWRGARSAKGWSIWGSRGGMRFGKQRFGMAPRRFLGFARSFLVGAFLCVFWRAEGGALDSWSWRNPARPANAIADVTYAAGQFVAVGNFGTILTSPDANLWTVRDSGTLEWLHAVEYLNGKFVVIENATTDRAALLSSEDGVVWRRGNLPPRFEIFSVAFGNGVFVLIGNKTEVIEEAPNWFRYVVLGTVWTSVDAINWVKRFELEAFDIGEGATVVFAGGRFSFQRPSPFVGFPVFPPDDVSGPDMGLKTEPVPPSEVFTSVDGVDWTAQETAAGTPHFWRSVGVGNAAFALGFSPATPFNTNIWTTSDAIHWRPIEIGATNFIGVLSASEGALFAVTREAIFKSKDGADWTPMPAITDEVRITAVAGNEQVTVAVEDHYYHPGGQSLLTCNNETGWTDQSSPTADTDLLALAAGRGVLVAAGHAEPSRAGVILTSTDGVGWTRSYETPVAWFTAITQGNGRILAVGRSAENRDYPAAFVVSSVDGFTWGNRVEVNYGSFNGAAFGNDVFVIAGGLHVSDIACSSDGVSWISQRLPQYQLIADIAFAKGTFVAVGHRWEGVFDFGKIWTSSDGLNWTAEEIAGAGAFTGVAYGNGAFVATASGGATYTSEDGRTWQRRSAQQGLSFGRVVYGNGCFLAVGSPYLPILSGSANTVWSSVDGTIWAAHRMKGPIAKLLFTGESFYAVGRGGTILESEPIATARVLWDSGVEGVSLQIFGSVGQTIELDRSANFVEWSSLRSLTLTNSVQTVLDASMPSGAAAFYQVRIVPQGK